ncbi:hypothetical protein E2P81_ATG01025 [Venturia nashicola]|uniref:Domain of unknown function at the cortex 1 domain-containing protein n=1 Tax=Venturia nashicola TaxID=86259 RepID=A0A4Z1PQZ0_9PEZI|nr:hypothetical protein E6O75_ATG01048 [Venturia nashicola]TLD38482.1 hypothetical protein E2P81_ATG01025 [Venturia nashicola]
MVSHLKNKAVNAVMSTPDDDSPEGNGDKYILRISAGPSYDISTHQYLPVNSEVPTAFENEFMTTKLKVRIRGYNGLPRTSSSHSPYFDHPMHSRDQYSIGFSFVPKKDLDAVHAAWGNDFDHPVRDRLPPGFNYALEIVKKVIDPAMEVDAYADKPWLWSPALDGFFKLRIGEKLSPEEQRNIPHSAESEPLEEGADGSGKQIREASGMPDNSEKRRKYFMNEENRAKFGVFEKDRLYHADFFNPFIDFNKFALKLPGFSLKVMKYINDKTHVLRYVFKNRQSDEVYFVVNITLLFGDDVAPALQEEDERSREASRGASMDGVPVGEQIQQRYEEPRQEIPFRQSQAQQEEPTTRSITKDPPPTQDTAPAPSPTVRHPPPPARQNEALTFQKTIAHQQNLAQAVPGHQQSSPGYQYGPGNHPEPQMPSTQKITSMLDPDEDGAQSPKEEFHDAKTSQ